MLNNRQSVIITTGTGQPRARASTYSSTPVPGSQSTRVRATSTETPVSTEQRELNSEDELERRLAALKCSGADSEDSSSEVAKQLSSVAEKDSDMKEEDADNSKVVERPSTGEGDGAGEGDAVVKESSKDKDVEEEVQFRSLVSLKCSLHFGQSNDMDALSKRAKDYLTEAVKQVHQALGIHRVSKLIVHQLLLFSASDKMVMVFSKAYPEIGDDPNEVCVSALELTFFPALMEHLKAVYR